MNNQHDASPDASPKYEHQQQQQYAAEGPPPVVPTDPPAATDDVENQTRGTSTAGFGVPGILQRWKREDLIRRGSFSIRGLALVFSLLAFVIMASNKHGDWKNFDKYEEYRYLLAIAILATMYTGVQAFRHAQMLSTGKEVYFHQRTSALVDFIGDQIMAYLLISATSAAIPLTNNMREAQDNIFTGASAASISMAFLAFVALALSAVISGHKLSSQSYI